MNAIKFLRLAILVPVTACTTINVDQVRLEETVEIKKGDALVVLGRRQTPTIETERSLVECLGRKLNSSIKNARVLPEKGFIDAFYPWFEPRTAPLTPKKLQSLLDKEMIAEKIDALNLKYLVWVEGSTETTSRAGSMSCSIGPGGGGCFGFGTWEDTSDYETTIWSLNPLVEVGRISTEAVGTSYMPAFVVPIPLLARVEGDACKGMGNQLVRFFAKRDLQLQE